MTDLLSSKITDCIYESRNIGLLKYKKNTVAFHNETVHNNKQLKMKTLLSFFIKFLVLVLNGK